MQVLQVKPKQTIILLLHFFPRLYYVLVFFVLLFDELLQLSPPLDDCLEGAEGGVGNFFPVSAFGVCEGC